MPDDVTAKDLEARVRETFPSLAFQKAQLDSYGEDNHVLVLDRAWIVRCPRNAENIGRFGAELRLLDALRGISPVRVPEYTHVSADQSIGAYRLIAGAELTPPVFALLTTGARRTVLMDVARFLTVLHPLPAETIAQLDGHIQRTWSGEQFAALYRGMRRARIARVAPPQMIARFDAFHAAFEKGAPGVPRLAHNDLSDDHILVREDGTLGGIIDFSDAAWGDPSIDFAYFWRLGEDAVDLVLETYGLTAQDPGLKTRSHWTFVRYLINQIYYGDRAKWNLPPDQALAEIDVHLKRLGL